MRPHGAPSRYESISSPLTGGTLHTSPCVKIGLASAGTFKQLKRNTLQVQKGKNLCRSACFFY